MNIKPGHLAYSHHEFQQLIDEKSTNFVGRDFVFSTITDFLKYQPCGYFTIVGAPGSGKSAILAHYAINNPQVVYYSAQVEGKEFASEFLNTVCTQLMKELGTGNMSLPDNATAGSWFLSLLLQKLSDLLEPDKHLIIAIDGCDRIDRKNQPQDSNLFYLPRYLPERVYFLLTRRPFLSEKSGLLIETPAQILDLEAYPEQNRQDVETYIQQYFSRKPSLLKESGWLTNYNISQRELCQRLTVSSENNFMYLSQILDAITQGFYPEPFQFDQLPPGLEAYYQNHWQRIKGKGLSSVALAVLRCLSQSQQPLNAELIAQMVDEDGYVLEKVLENWREFLNQETVGEETVYSFYHSNFRDWLSRQLNLS
ncbi:AAA family ATPase [Iningainema tapete]|uniref:ATP-binding protein n=1 Tax=Iningainema tapete BLCC-T55 TaxID=2748662 RepID=A0A8J6XTX2_9CYAN|nr:AAA family ATPase [Iningainema tapete]MBD2778195.1 ATP-binding protein [Iningainema tapete BLCC-T55]